MSTYPMVVISPATTTNPVVRRVSQATRPLGSSVRMASRMASETWSAILSGWPSVTDSEVYSHRRVMSLLRSGDRASRAGRDVLRILPLVAGFQCIRHPVQDHLRDARFQLQGHVFLRA